jgi:hypothetical protein
MITWDHDSCCRFLRLTIEKISHSKKMNRFTPEYQRTQPCKVSDRSRSLGASKSEYEAVTFTLSFQMINIHIPIFTLRVPVLSTCPILHQITCYVDHITQLTVPRTLVRAGTVLFTLVSLALLFSPDNLLFLHVEPATVN